MNKKPSSLEKVWSTLGVLGGVLSLSSMAEAIVSWPAFVKLVIEKYQEFVHPIFNFIFGWLPFSIPTLVFDYLVIGLIWFFALVRAATKIQFEALPDLVYRPFMHIICWPYYFTLMAWNLPALKKQANYDDYAKIVFSDISTAIKNVAAMILIFVFLIILSIAWKMHAS